ncbi:MAG: RHS repeat-associated core domain-containing protein [Candidatus Diapherotrites archaeon]
MATARRLTYTRGQGLPGGIGGLLDLCQGGAQYSYLYDGKGNVTALLDANANIAATYAYGPFGEPRVPSNYLQQPMQFSTKPYDEKTGLSYYGYRYYVPALGRWLTRDPLGEEGEINLYGFVGNDPVNFVDPLGLYYLGPGDLRNCIGACKRGGERLACYCRSLPTPQLRAGCWALMFASETACIGWCYWHFGK